MISKPSSTWSDMPIPPGEILAEELEARGMTQRELAARLGRPAQVVNEIVNAKKAITPDTALELEMVLGIDAHYWANLEGRYRMTLARQRAQDERVAGVAALDHYPIREMTRRGWIKAGLDKPGKVKALQMFLGLAVVEPHAYTEAIGFRITEAAQRKVSLGALSVWLRKGELEAQNVCTAAYDAEAFRQALLDIRRLTLQPLNEFIPTMSALCADAGVAFCLVPELPRSGANGVARWLTDGQALIQMSLRAKWADVFWFSFFHEACHILRHRTQRRIVVDGLGRDPDLTEMEAEADAFASDMLIPPGSWQDFCNDGDFSLASTREFARSVEIAPFIVVGRLQKEKWIGYSQLATLKTRYKWSDL